MLAASKSSCCCSFSLGPGLIRLSRVRIGAIRLGTIALTFLIVATATAVANGFQTENRKTTPDPYFPKVDSSSAESPLKTSLKPSVASNQKKSWTAPRTPIEIQQRQIKLPGQATKKPPANLEKPAPTTNGFEPFKIPSQAPTTKTPQSFETGPPASIIRPPTAPPKNRLTPSTTFDSNVGPSNFERDIESSAPQSMANRTPNKNEATKPTEPEAFEPSRVLALVGGEPIFVGDMLFEINQMLEKHMPTAPASIKERERQKLIPRMLPKFVEAKILFQGAISKLPDEVDIDNVIEQAGDEFDQKALPKMMESANIKTTGEFDAHLRGQGSSLRQLRRSWSIEQLTKIFVGQQINKAGEVTHRDLLIEYKKNLESYAFPAKAKWEQVMVSFRKSDSPAAARQKIEALSLKLVNGANLQALAKKESDGFRAYNGGQHDWTTQGALVLKTLDKAIFSLPVGKLSDVIETADGYHIVRVIDRKEAGRTPFVEAQVEIKKRLLEEKRKEAFKKYLDELREQVPVEYLIND